MLCGYTPFKGRTIIETYQAIQNVTELKFKEGIDPQAKDLVEKLLKKEPSERLGALNFEELKNHPYFHELDWDNLRTSIVPFVQPLMRRGVRNLKVATNAKASANPRASDRLKISTSFAGVIDGSPLLPAESPSGSPLASPTR